MSIKQAIPKVLVTQHIPQRTCKLQSTITLHSSFPSCNVIANATFNHLLYLSTSNTVAEHTELGLN